jgi:tetratricopeptide (TPR) repeat protein
MPMLFSRTRCGGVAMTLITLITLTAFTLSGCALPRPQGKGGIGGTNPGDTAPISSDPEMQKAAATIKPLPRLVEDYPAPEKTPGLDVAETAQAQNPNDPQANLTLAFSYYKSRAFVDASSAFARAARLMPDDPTPLLYLGYTQMAAGAQDAAIATFEKVLALKNVSRDTQSEAYLQIGTAHGAMERNEKAMAAYSKSLGFNTRQGKASLALGAWAAQNKRWSQAKDFFTDAANDLPPGRHKAQAYASLGMIAEAAKDTKTALAHYRKALATDEDNQWATEGIARLAPEKPEKPATVYSTP